MAKTNLEKAKRNKKIFGRLSLGTVFASAAGIPAYLQYQYTKVVDYLHNSPEKIDAMKEFLNGYGCENKQQFDQLLADNSTTVKKIVLEDGVFVEKTKVYYNAFANEAAQGYHDVYDAILNAPADYMAIDPTVIGLAIAVPVVCILAYAVYRHKYKKLLKAQEQAQENEPNA